MTRYTATQRLLMNDLRNNPQTTVEQIATNIHSTVATVRCLTYELLRHGVIERSGRGSAATFALAGGHHD